MHEFHFLKIFSVDGKMSKLGLLGNRIYYWRVLALFKIYMILYKLELLTEKILVANYHLAFWSSFYSEIVKRKPLKVGLQDFLFTENMFLIKITFIS